MNTNTIPGDWKEAIVPYLTRLINITMNTNTIPGDWKEAIVPYLTRLINITMNTNAIAGNRKKAVVVPNYRLGDRSVDENYRPVSLTSVVCELKEHATAGYPRHVWETSGWLCEVLRDFRPGYSSESQLRFVRILQTHWTREAGQML
jgi:hypothetical protein